MGAVQPLPHRGETFVDSRNGGRMLRVSGHPDAGTVVLSIWDHDHCRASFRLPASAVDELVRALLTAAPAQPPEVRPLLAVPPVPQPPEPPDPVRPPDQASAPDHPGPPAADPPVGPPAVGPPTAGPPAAAGAPDAVDQSDQATPPGAAG